MKKIMFVIVILVLLTACAPAPTYDIQATIAMGMDQTRAAEPTATFTPEPTPDIQATINAGIAATQAAQPSPTSPPTPTSPPIPTETDIPQVEASYAAFLDNYKANFEAMKSKMSTPVTSTIHKIDFEENELGTSTLWIETTGYASDISATLLGYTIGVLTGLISEQPGDSDYVPIVLPEDLELVRLVFRDEALVERGHFFTTWAEMLDYNNKRIEFIDMFNNSDWDLP
ncbi:MAG TPA: membrane lipoprotein lipid attachment site-containing protein [Anaerolineaceae bacterium]|nr:membrane lipoprotein lipid attachment site-containing protein [Anaerolineaceae bacterium]